MDASLGLTLSRGVQIVAAILVVLGLVGIWYYGSKVQEEKDKIIKTLRHQIVSANAVVELIFNAPYQRVDGFACYISFKKGNITLLGINVNGYIQDGSKEGVTKYISHFDLSASGSVVKASLDELVTADTLEVSFRNIGCSPRIPNGATLSSGKLQLTINRNRSVEISLDSAVVNNGMIMWTDLQSLGGLLME